MGDGSALDSTYYRLFDPIALFCHCVIDLELSMEQNRDSFHKYTGISAYADSDDCNDKRSESIFHCACRHFCAVDF